jgi:hypothetical protein
MKTFQLLASFILAFLATAILPPCGNAHETDDAPKAIYTIIVDGTTACRDTAGEALTAGIADGQYTGSLTNATGLAACYSRGTADDVTDSESLIYFLATSNSGKFCRLYDDDSVDGDCSGTWDVASAAYDITFDDGAASATATASYSHGGATSQTSIIVDLCSTLWPAGTLKSIESEADECPHGLTSVRVVSPVGAVGAVEPVALQFISVSGGYDTTEIINDGYLQSTGLTSYSDYTKSQLIMIDSGGLASASQPPIPIPGNQRHYLAISVPGGNTDTLSIWITLESSTRAWPDKIIEAKTGAISVNLAP